MIPVVVGWARDLAASLFWIAVVLALAVLVPLILFNPLARLDRKPCRARAGPQGSDSVTLRTGAPE